LCCGYVSVFDQAHPAFVHGSVGGAPEQEGEELALGLDAANGPPPTHPIAAIWVTEFY
jgi:hypothetical protein